MNILAVDTSGNACSVAVLSDEKIICEIFADYKKTHSETLAPMTDDCLSRAGMEIKNIDLFCCAVGPGSFTGLRIGTSMIKAFSHVSKKPAIGVNTLDALAENVKGTREYICPVIDARRGDVYTATYKDGSKITDYRAVPLDIVLEEQSGKDTIFLGDAAVIFKDKIIKASDSFRIARSGSIMQRAGSVGLAAYSLYQNNEYKNAYTLEPFYLRETQAERVYAQKNKRV